MGLILLLHILRSFIEVSLWFHKLSIVFLLIIVLLYITNYGLIDIGAYHLILLLMFVVMRNSMSGCHLLVTTWLRLKLRIGNHSKDVEIFSHRRISHIICLITL